MVSGIEPKFYMLSMQQDAIDIENKPAIASGRKIKLIEAVSKQFHQVLNKIISLVNLLFSIFSPKANVAKENKPHIIRSPKEELEIKEATAPIFESPKVAESPIDQRFEIHTPAELMSSQFYFGHLSRLFSEQLLEKEAIGAGLLRYSDNINDFVLSYKIQEGVYEHRQLSGESLAEAKRAAKVQQLLIHKHTAASPEVQKITSIKKGRKEKVAKYDQQIILSLGSGKTAKGLNAKAAKSYLPSESIDLRDSDSCLTPISKLTASSRLYLVGHCDQGKNAITSDEGVTKTVQDYVDMLVKYAPHLTKTTSPKKRIKISVVACWSAVDSAGQKSFGYQLSQALDKAGIHAEVLARTGPVSRWQDEAHPELYKKFVNGEYHEAGSKLSFITENGSTNITAVKYPLSLNEIAEKRRSIPTS